MTGTCPNCGATLELKDDGTNECTRCSYYHPWNEGIPSEDQLREDFTPKEVAKKVEEDDPKICPFCGREMVEQETRYQCPGDLHECEGWDYDGPYWERKKGDK
jgi:DNA-directed RNA polymerase subunit M/transcription elongation factor TFIIS